MLQQLGQLKKTGVDIKIYPEVTELFSSFVFFFFSFFGYKKKNRGT